MAEKDIKLDSLKGKKVVLVGYRKLNLDGEEVGQSFGVLFDVPKTIGDTTYPIQGLAGPKDKRFPVYGLLTPDAGTSDKGKKRPSLRLFRVHDGVELVEWYVGFPAETSEKKKAFHFGHTVLGQKIELSFYAVSDKEAKEAAAEVE